MARLCHDGAELAPNTAIDVIVPNNPTRDTGTFRAPGVAAWKCINAAMNVKSPSRFAINVANTSYFVRAYMNFAVIPSGTSNIMSLGNTVGDLEVRITSAGVLQLFRGTTQIGSDSAALSTGTWYRLELSGTLGAGGTNWTAAELRQDGVTLASGSGFTQARTGSQASVGFVTTPGTGTVYVDDFAVNDSSGAANNTWPGEGNVIAMFPISDNARGAWTAGAGGTTNLFDAVNNIPPVGVADASATNTSQIKNKSTTNPTNCDFNLATYTAAGVTGTVNAIQLLTVSGEDPSTGTKAGTMEMVSNPVIGTTSFNFGNDAGAQGTYVGFWFVSVQTTYTQAPTVTLGTAPVLRVTCVSGATATRAASICFLAASVEFTPAVSVSRVPRSPGVDSGFGVLCKAHQAVRRWRHGRSGILVPDGVAWAQ